MVLWHYLCSFYEMVISLTLHSLFAFNQSYNNLLDLIQLFNFPDFPNLWSGLLKTWKLSARWCKVVSLWFSRVTSLYKCGIYICYCCCFQSYEPRYILSLGILLVVKTLLNYKGRQSYTSSKKITYCTQTPIHIWSQKTWGHRVRA